MDVADSEYDSSVLWLGDHGAWTLGIQVVFKFSVYYFRLNLECPRTKILSGTKSISSRVSRTWNGFWSVIFWKKL